MRGFVLTLFLVPLLSGCFDDDRLLLVAHGLREGSVDEFDGTAIEWASVTPDDKIWPLVNEALDQVHAERLNRTDPYDAEIYLFVSEAEWLAAGSYIDDLWPEPTPCSPGRFCTPFLYEGWHYRLYMSKIVH